MYTRRNCRVNREGKVLFLMPIFLCKINKNVTLLFIKAMPLFCTQTHRTRKIYVYRMKSNFNINEKPKNHCKINARGKPGIG